MKRTIMLAAVAALLMAIAVPVEIQAAEDQQVVSVTLVQAQAEEKPGFFKRLWELEKKKNAWILRKLGWR